MTVFDVGRIALDRADIKVDKYYSSEIDKYANQVGQRHYPDTIELGDMTKWKDWDIDWASIDLVIAGTPLSSLFLLQEIIKDLKEKWIIF